jgi:hypothetical protein
VTPFAEGGEAVVFEAHSVGRSAEGKVVAGFDVLWSFKRRS